VCLRPCRASVVTLVSSLLFARGGSAQPRCRNCATAGSGHAKAAVTVQRVLGSSHPPDPLQLACTLHTKGRSDGDADGNKVPVEGTLPRERNNEEKRESLAREESAGGARAREAEAWQSTLASTQTSPLAFIRDLENAVRQAPTPVIGRAVFHARTDGSSTVTYATVAECNTNRDAWIRAAEVALIAQRTGNRTPTRGASTEAGTSKGASRAVREADIAIEVVSTWQLPSGHNPGTDVSLFGIPTQRGTGPRSPSVALLDVLPKFRTIEVSPSVRIPVVSIDPALIRIHADAANADAKATRIVHARVVPRAHAP